MDIFITSIAVIAIFMTIVMLVIHGAQLSGNREDAIHKLDSHGRYRAPSTHSYHAVTVCAMEGGCEAVNKLPQRRYLVDEAPLLPLPDCTVERCNCRYNHHQDRREPEHERRASLVAATTKQASEGGRDRRRPRGRRRADLAMA
jgi:hypothetical protein